LTHFVMHVTKRKAQYYFHRSMRSFYRSVAGDAWLCAEAVAARVAAGDGGAEAAAAAGAGRKAKISKKAARRAERRAAREEEEGYVGDGVWDRDGFDVVVAGRARVPRTVCLGFRV